MRDDAATPRPRTDESESVSDSELYANLVSNHAALLPYGLSLERHLTLLALRYGAGQLRVQDVPHICAQVFIVHAYYAHHSTGPPTPLFPSSPLSSHSSPSSDLGATCYPSRAASSSLSPWYSATGCTPGPPVLFPRPTHRGPASNPHPEPLPSPGSDGTATGRPACSAHTPRSPHARTTSSGTLRTPTRDVLFWNQMECSQLLVARSPCAARTPPAPCHLLDSAAASEDEAGDGSVHTGCGGQGLSPFHLPRGRASRSLSRSLSNLSDSITVTEDSTGQHFILQRSMTLGSVSVHAPSPRPPTAATLPDERTAHSLAAPAPAGAASWPPWQTWLLPRSARGADRDDAPTPRSTSRCSLLRELDSRLHRNTSVSCARPLLQEDEGAAAATLDQLAGATWQTPAFGARAQELLAPYEQSAAVPTPRTRSLAHLPPLPFRFVHTAPVGLRTSFPRTPSTSCSQGTSGSSWQEQLPPPLQFISDTLSEDRSVCGFTAQPGANYTPIIQAMLASPLPPLARRTSGGSVRHARSSTASTTTAELFAIAAQTGAIKPRQLAPAGTASRAAAQSIPNFCFFASPVDCVQASAPGRSGSLEAPVLNSDNRDACPKPPWPKPTRQPQHADAARPPPDTLAPSQPSRTSFLGRVAHTTGEHDAEVCVIDDATRPVSTASYSSHPGEVASTDGGSSDALALTALEGVGAADVLMLQGAESRVGRGAPGRHLAPLPPPTAPSEQSADEVSLECPLPSRRDERVPVRQRGATILKCLTPLPQTAASRAASSVSCELLPQPGHVHAVQQWRADADADASPSRPERVTSGSSAAGTEGGSGPCERPGRRDGRAAHPGPGGQASCGGAGGAATQLALELHEAAPAAQPTWAQERGAAAARKERQLAAAAAGGLGPEPPADGVRGVNVWGANRAGVGCRARRKGSIAVSRGAVVKERRGGDATAREGRVRASAALARGDPSHPLPHAQRSCKAQAIARQPPPAAAPGHTDAALDLRLGPIDSCSVAEQVQGCGGRDHTSCGIAGGFGPQEEFRAAEKVFQEADVWQAGVLKTSEEGCRREGGGRHRLRACRKL